jgi:hypothetical protein
MKIQLQDRRKNEKAQQATILRTNSKNNKNNKRKIPTSNNTKDQFKK